ncbi:MAG: hypothetical protein RI958_1387 [Actinomycetota bacterium]|jgi:acyl-CoA synthetase (AMP-forming)/AMP-acid ligase II
MELNIAVVHEAIAAAVPERDCLVWRARRHSWAEVTERTRRLANVLIDAGLGVRREHGLAPWESGQDHLALYLTNGNEYLEGMLGAYKARVAPFNVNYRYVAEELRYLFDDARPRAMIFHARYVPILEEVLAAVEHRPELLLQVADETGNELLLGARDYDEALAASSPQPPPVEPQPDDLYLVYTGGTTGMPKGVLWRQADFLVGALGVCRKDGTDYERLDELVERARTTNLRSCPAPPLMHGAAHWNAISTWMGGGTVVIQSDPGRLDARDILATIERERVTSLNIVGDAFARPLLEELRHHHYDLSSLRHVVSGGAVLSGAVKRELESRIAGLQIVDIVGGSESGRQAMATGADRQSFAPSSGAAVLSNDRTRRLAAGDDEIGWLAQTGRLPRGYLNDQAKTEATFPVIESVRYVVAGDRARIAEDGSIILLGRESVTINTGGEKVFAEEVEHALKQHPALYDALVVGRPSDQWGHEVVAIVRVRDGIEVDDTELIVEASRHIARYKLPKAIIRVEAIGRSPSGKPDYQWARSVALAGQPQPGRSTP